MNKNRTLWFRNESNKSAATFWKTIGEKSLHNLNHVFTILQGCWKINRGITSGSSLLDFRHNFRLLLRHDNWNKAFKFLGTSCLPMSSLDEIHWWLSIFRKPIWFFLLLMIVREVKEFCVCASEQLKASTTRRKTYGWVRGVGVQIFGP